ncbi:MAG: RsmE family RNA methyltransferase [Candidatus Eiseniibacteriota bacterium]
MPAEAAPSLLLVDDLPGTGGRVALPEDESHYLTRVCRARPGDRVSATDGRGALATLRMVEGGRSAALEVESCARSERTRAAWVLSGPPEGERGDWMVEKLAELGVAAFLPVDCERGGWERMKGRVDRWRRLAVAALRQSRRRFLIEIREPLPFGEALAILPAGGGRWLGAMDGAAAAGIRPSATGLSAGLIGPSSGLSEPERDAAARAGFAPICLSDGRLRAETAAVAWACWWSGGAPGASGASE